MNNNPNTKSYPAASKQSGAVVTRFIVTGVVVLVTLLIIALVVPWTAYRFRNVVVGEAAIKGVVTKIGARIEGRIKSIEAEVGQHVSKGQVLVTLEDTHLRAALDRARAELQSATQELEMEKLGIEQSRRRLTLEISRAIGATNKAAGDLKAQQSQVTRAVELYHATTNLFAQNVASRIEMQRMIADRDQALGILDAKIGALETAQANYERAMNELEGLHVREQHLGVLEAQVAANRARVTVAEADLEATVMKSPEDGRVLERIVEVGGSAKVGEPMLSLWVGRPWVEAWVDERDLRKFKVGSSAEISLDASPSRKLAGRVEAIGLESDKQLQPLPVPATIHSFLRVNAMVPVRVALEEESASIQLGLSAVVGIKKGDLPKTEQPQVAKPSSPAAGFTNTQAAMMSPDAGHATPVMPTKAPPLVAR